MEAVKKKTMKDLTRGPVLGKLLLFILPLMASNLLQTLYNAADMMVVSLSHEANAVGAIGTTASFINMIVNIFIGFSAGATVVIARRIGEKDDDATSRTVHTAIVLALISGVLAGICGLFIAKPVLGLLGNHGKLLELSVLYTQIYFCGIPFISLTNYCIAIFRAKGDTKTPLFVLSAAGAANVLLNLFFVLICHMSVEGVALATTISNFLSAGVLLFLLMRAEDACQLSLKKLRIDRRALSGIVYIGLPSGIQGALFSVSNMLIQSSIIRVNNQYGFTGDAYQPVVDGNAAVSNLEGFIYTSVNAVTQAAITFTSQHVGAGKHRRIRRVAGVSYITAFAVSAFFVGLLLLFCRPLLGLYGVVGGDYAKDIAVETAMTRIRLTIVPYMTLAFMDVGSGIMRGLGKAISSTVITLAGACLFRIVWILTVFNRWQILEMIYISYPISWLLTGGVQLVCILLAIRHMIKRKEARAAIERT